MLWYVNVHFFDLRQFRRKTSILFLFVMATDFFQDFCSWFVISRSKQLHLIIWSCRKFMNITVCFEQYCTRINNKIKCEVVTDSVLWWREVRHTENCVPFKGTFWILKFLFFSISMEVCWNNILSEMGGVASTHRGVFWMERFNCRVSRARTPRNVCAQSHFTLMVVTCEITSNEIC